MSAWGQTLPRHFSKGAAAVPQKAAPASRQVGAVTGQERALAPRRRWHPVRSNLLASIFYAGRRIA
jgi:hypothetical protein